VISRWFTARAAASGLATVLAAGVLWSPPSAARATVAAPSRPAPRAFSAMAGDEYHGQVVLFGGWNGNPLARTWTWDGAEWLKHTPRHSPQPRTTSMAYDGTRRKVVLFGGCCAKDTGDPFGDTRIWNGRAWKHRLPAHAPTARWGAMMAFDTQRRQVVLFGGFDGLNYLGDTWTWDGRDWTRQTPAHSPPERAVGGMVWDSDRREVLLFGGFGWSNALDDTWTWNGTDWTKRTPAHAPPARDYMGMAFDYAHGQAVLVGGTSGSLEESFDDMWTWDGTDWTQRFPRHQPTTRVAPAMSFDMVRFNVELFGGWDPNSGYLGDTWTWDGTDWTEDST
jgi:hypothetical protein